jgi:desulfoferrodoxin (superoxide reductase-like protein)
MGWQKGGTTMRDALKSLFKLIVCSSIVAGALVITHATTAMANKTAVAISAPASAAPGSEITIQVTATHNANNFLHYTNWLYVMVNGKEIARWNYTRTNRPESSVFTREIKYTVTDSIEIKAEGHCNMHGSKGPATAKVSVSTTAN